MQRCRFHVDEICTTCRFHVDKICTLADFMRITTFYILFIFPLAHFTPLTPIKKTASHAFNAGKRPFYFPLFFKLLQATQLLFFYAAFTAHTLSLIVLIAASPAAFLFFYAAFGGLLFPLLFVSINHPRAQQQPRFRRFSYFFFKKLIMPRSCAPTCSAWVCAARRRIALNCGRPHWFSSSHFLAKVPS